MTLHLYCMRSSHWKVRFSIFFIYFELHGLREIFFKTKSVLLLWIVISSSLTEQSLLEHVTQTPPPSPFSVQAFNRAAAANGAQGFDYGISNNKGELNVA